MIDIFFKKFIIFIFKNIKNAFLKISINTKTQQIMFEKILITLADQQIEIEIADNPISVGNIVGRTVFFMSDFLNKYYNDNFKIDTIADKMVEIGKAFSTIYDRVGDDKLKELYFKDSDKNAITNLVDVVKSPKVFKQNTTERKIVKEFLTAYKLYNDQTTKLIDIDPDGLIFFRE